MKKWHVKGYLCERCHEKPAKYESRSSLNRRKNILVCLPCLQAMSQKQTSSSISETPHMGWLQDSSEHHTNPKET
ncbi:hypothetical protein IC620_01870 [Hazenella sp. IB182357]|uniref:Uncharacterized protein n=1 Tax=Polycladospora coralii TaxID=2771432 RepID=A0A926N9P7_9BACL|nr:hypothetical protein [Polycladospora coralii]MBD1371105.1 hypothetical protein [Polycladospora coralii]MBS7530047.1 hypothetical protein [Polycladospora coralii]